MASGSEGKIIDRERHTHDRTQVPSADLSFLILFDPTHREELSQYYIILHRTNTIIAVDEEV